MDTGIHSTLQNEIEWTQQKFHRLLVTVPDTAMKLSSKDPGWTNGELLDRMSVAGLIIPHVLKNNAAENPRLSFIFQIVRSNVIYRTKESFVRTRAANINHWAIAWQYDNTTAPVLEALDSIPNNSFDQMLQISDSDPLLPGPVTVEQLFHYAKNHFDAYSQQLNLVQ
jgi:hypothetical protein